MRVTIAVLLVAILASLAWLVLREPPSPAPVNPSDMRIVSLSPTLTETVYDLGAGRWLVGVTSYCNYPPAATGVERIGDFINPNTERIVALRPTLVLAERWTSSRIVPKLSAMGLPVVETVSPASIHEIDQLLRQVGKAVGKTQKAEELILQMHTRIHAIERRAEGLDHRPSVYVEIDPPSWTVGRKSYTSEAIAVAGGQNIFDDVDIASLLASKEEIVRRDPELIIAFSARRSEIASRAGWGGIRAVQNRKIVDDFNRDLLSRGSLRLVEGIEKLATVIETAAGVRRLPEAQRTPEEDDR